MLLLLLISAFITDTGEEIGWRGFFLPKLSEMMNIKTAILISEIIWALWHFPLMIAGLYQSGTVIWYQFISFTIEIIAITAIMAYLRMESQSVWPCIVLHAIHNYFDQIIFNPLTSAQNEAYFVGETGIITIIISIVIAIVFLKKIEE